MVSIMYKVIPAVYEDAVVKLKENGRIKDKDNVFVLVETMSKNIVNRTKGIISLPLKEIEGIIEDIEYEEQ